MPVSPGAPSHTRSHLVGQESLYLVDMSGRVFWAEETLDLTTMHSKKHSTNSAKIPQQDLGNTMKMTNLSLDLIRLGKGTQVANMKINDDDDLEWQPG